MTTYFDPTNADDLLLLPTGYREDKDLPVLAGVCEADVIDYFTEVPSYWWLATSQLGFIQYPWGWGGLENPGVDITAGGPNAPTTNARVRVYLKGFRPNDPNNPSTTGSSDPLVDPNLASALKRTIALVLAWRISRWKFVKPGIASEASDIGKSTVFQKNAEDAFPPDWIRALIPYAAGRAPWGF